MVRTMAKGVNVMPDDINEDWEYWEPDPEIMEATGGYTDRSMGSLIQRTKDGTQDGLAGFRIGNPNRNCTHVAAEKPPAVRGRPKTLADRVCPACEKAYSPKRETQTYCCAECAARGMSRALMRPRLNITCPVCGTDFITRDARRQYCSRECRDKKCRKYDADLFAWMWQEGFTTQQIATRFNLSEFRVRQLRQKMDLPPRSISRSYGQKWHEDMVMRGRLPDRRRSWTQTVEIPDFNGVFQRFYLTCGEFPDGRLGEIWIEAAKEGTFLRGMVGAMARSVSITLQTQTPPGSRPEEVVHMLRELSFPPQGVVRADKTEVKLCTSVADWIAQEIENVYIKRTSSRPVSPHVGDGRGPDRDHSGDVDRPTGESAVSAG